MQELIDLEVQGWRALATEGDAGRNFYASVLREDAVMLFPGGMRIEGRERILQSLGAQPWETYELKDLNVLALTEDAAAVIYKATARRKGSEPYTALICSTYVRAATWQLVVHQQSPI